jgi:hypothetical protein
MKKAFTMSMTLALSICFSNLTWASKFTSNEYITKNAPFNTEWKKSIKPIQWNPTTTIAMIKKQEKSRKLASELDQEFFENKMSKDFKKFRDEFLKIKTADELDLKLVELDTNYDHLAPDLKFAASQLVPMRALRGIVWRLIPTVKDTKIVHSMIVTQVKAMAINLKIFLPTDQWSAAFDYLTKPFVEDGNFPFIRKGEIVAQFPENSEVYVQGYIRSAIIPMIKKATDRLEQIDLGEDGAVWDNKLLYGPGSFPSAIDRYSLVGEVERHISLMHMYGSLSEACYQSAYSLEGALSLNKEIGKLYGYDSFFSAVDGVPAAKRIAIIREPKYQYWGRIFTDGKDWLSSSWYFLGQSVNHGDIAWSGLKDRNVSEVNFADNSYALPFQRPINLRFENLKKMMDGETTIRSFITEETATVNLKAFYLNPPSDLKDLYGQAPFEGGDEMVSMQLKSNSGVKKVNYRNYLKGRSINWKVDVYQQYFPGIKNSQDLQKTTRILSQGWGSFAVAMPLAGYLN